jgi:type I restriction enzyme S subunit
MATENLPLCLLGELADIVPDKIAGAKDATLPYVGLEHLATKSPDLIGQSAASASISTNSIFNAGDTLYGKLRPNLRKSVIAPFRGYCSTDILVLRAREGAASRFLGALLQAEGVASAAIGSAIGTKMPRTSWSALRSVSVFAPPPPPPPQH